jgi:hypothetical protein
MNWNPEARAYFDNEARERNRPFNFDAMRRNVRHGMWAGRRDDIFHEREQNERRARGEPEPDYGIIRIEAPAEADEEENTDPLRHLDLRNNQQNTGYSCKYAELLPQGVYCSNAQCPVTMSDLDATNTAAFVCQGATQVQTVLCYNMYFLFDYFMRKRRDNSRELPSLPDNRQVVALPDRIRLGIRVLSAIINGNVIGEEDNDHARPIVDELGDEIREVLAAYQNALAAYLEQ